MNQKSTRKLYPRDDDDFRDLHAEWDEDPRRSILIAAVSAFLRRRTGIEAIAIVTLIVLGYVSHAFRDVNDAHVWCLFVIDLLIVTFSIVVILIVRADGQNQEEETDRQDESGNEPESSRPVGTTKRRH